MLPEEALKQVPELAGRKYRVTPLPGGLTNRNFRVDFAGHSWVLRLDATHTAVFDLNRDLELAVHRHAQEAGLAPRLIHSDITQGILVREFLDGPVWTAADLSDDSKLEALALLVRRVHELPGTGVRLDAAERANHYARQLDQHPEMSKTAAACVRQIAAVPPPDAWCCSHNDVVAENIIESGSLYLLDWEYACDNDPLFDVVCIVSYHGLDGRQGELLLNALLGGADGAARERLAQQTKLFNALQWLWFACREVASPNHRNREQMQRIGSHLR